MSTRGAWGFIYKGKEYITYNHSDSYPEGIGRQLISHYHSLGARKIKTLIKKIKLINEDHKFATSEIKELKPYADLSVGDQTLESAYCLLRETQGNMIATLESGYMIESSSFLQDSLFCEWAYIFNLDTEMLEVYQGFQDEPHSKGRYSKLEAHHEKYQPVALIASFPLEGIHKMPFAEVVDLITTEQEGENEEVSTTEKQIISDTLKVFELSKFVAKKEI
jgi:hypothetical protein